MPYNGPAPAGPKPEPSPPPPPPRYPTGSGLIGQVGAKPGSSVYGSVLPPRPELIGPRLRHSPEIVRHDSGTFAAFGVASILMAAMACGFVLGWLAGITR